MKLETFFEKFELFAEAPDAVARMRELVLDLAVSGCLITPKTEWPKRSLKSLATKIGSGATPAGGRESYCSDGVPLIRSMNVYFRGFDRTGLAFLSDEQAAQLSNVVVQPHDVLLNITGASIGRVTTAPPEMAGARVNQHVTIIRPTQELLASFLRIFLASPSVQRMIDEIQVGATRQALTKGMIEQFEIPLPSPAEQTRIVAKVDELMALCDRLEAQQRERETRHAALARAALARFAEAPTPANLDFLFHPSYAITPDDLRKTILTLAFAGQLVPQDPNDEPASILLEKTRAEKARLIKAGLVKKEPWADKLQEANTLYELPPGWEWTHVSDVVEKVTVGYVGSMKEQYRDVGIPFLRCQNVRVNRYEPIGLTYISEGFHHAISKSTLRPGDVVVTRSGNVGVTCVIPDHLVEANCSDLVIVKRPLALIPSFLSYFINSIAAGQIKAKTVGIALTHFNTQSVAQLTVPLPPLAEQRRIVAKVDQLMALVDQLEAQLADAQAKAAVLLEAAIHEVLNPSAEVVDLARYRAAIGCYAMQKMQGKPYFGRTAAMKALYLAQAHVGLALDLKPLREAAGPLDTWIYDFEREGGRQAWFTFSEKTTSSGAKKIKYHAGKALAEQAKEADHLFSAGQRAEFDRLLALFSDRTTEQMELIATLFAAWNDFLIDGHAPSDDEIVTEVRENWHESKRRFGRDQLQQSLRWLRTHGLVPQGRAPHTIHQPQLRLH